MEALPNASELALNPGEETPAVEQAHGQILTALLANDLPVAQRLTADLLDQFDAREHRSPTAKTLRLIEFVVLLS